MANSSLPTLNGSKILKFSSEYSEYTNLYGTNYCKESMCYY